MTDHTITYDKQGNAVSFTGDAVQVYACATLASSLGLYLKTGMKPTRGVGLKRMLELAKFYTGKTYTRKTAPQAVEDLKAWTQTAKLSVEERTQS